MDQPLPLTLGPDSMAAWRVAVRRRGPMLALSPLLVGAALAVITLQAVSLARCCYLPVASRLWRNFCVQTRYSGFSAVVMRTFAFEQKFALLLSLAALISARRVAAMCRPALNRALGVHQKEAVVSSPFAAAPVSAGQR